MSATAGVRERQILFSGPMVRSILEGRKSQTRRVVKPQPVYPNHVDHDDERGWHIWWDEAPDGPSGPHSTGWAPLRCPYGQPGDLLYVRENARLEFWEGDYWVQYQAELTFVVADDPVAEDPSLQWIGDSLEDEAVARWATKGPWKDDGEGVKVTDWRPGRLVPKALSRIWLRVTDVRVERVQEITVEDVRGEGVRPGRQYGTDHSAYEVAMQAAFRDLWDSINASRAPWSDNPWVWAVSFERAEAP